MTKSTKIFLIILGVITIGAGIAYYISEKDVSNTYFAIFIGVALIVMVISIPEKEKED